MAKKKTNTTEKIKTKGIVLLAFGRPGYAMAAYNMAFSIKFHNAKIPITLFICSKTKDHLVDFNYFDQVFELEDEQFMNWGVVDPGYLKVNMYDFLPYDENLYLDVDGMAIKDLQPVIDYFSDQKGHIYTEVMGKGKRGDKINYDIWATHETVWEYFGLKEDAILPAIQSSFMYIKKGKDSKKVFDEAKKFFDKGFKRKDLLETWGQTIPDELIFNGVFAKLGYIPESELSPIFFGWNKGPVLTPTQVENEYYILSIYGNGVGRTLTRTRYLQLYDQLLEKYYRIVGKGHIYKMRKIMQDKHLNFR